MKEDIEKKAEKIEPGVNFVRLYENKKFRGKFLALLFNDEIGYYVWDCSKSIDALLKRLKKDSYLDPIITFLPKNPSSYLIL